MTHNEHLRDLVIAAEYLSEVLEDDGKTVILMGLRNIAEAQVGGISGLAHIRTLGRGVCIKMLATNGNPELSRFTKVIHDLA